MSIRKGCRLYPRAILWSALLSLTIVLEGYGSILIQNFLIFPEFKEAFGMPMTTEPLPKYEISSAWQAGLINAAYAGEIIGLVINGFLTEWFGYHRVMVGSLVCLSLLFFLAVFAINVEMLVAAQVLCGLPWGIFQTLSMSYAAEVMPTALRAYLTANINNCWLIGQICSVAIARGCIEIRSEWSFRMPLALQWAFAVPPLLAILFAPESPWWLVRHGRYEHARESLRRLTRTRSDEKVDIDKTVSMLRHTNEVEKYLNGETVSYLSCFKGTDLRRTEIACVVWSTQALCGGTLAGYAPYFYQQAGLSEKNSLNIAIAMFGAALIGGLLSWILLRFFGRRKLWMWGLSLCFAILMITGGVGTMAASESASWTLGSLIVILMLIYDTTIGPVGYVLVAEIPSTRLRIKTVVLARIAFLSMSVVFNIITPRMLNPTAWNWRGKSAFLYAGTAFCCFVWAYFRLPEPRGLTYLELDILFNKKASARKFRLLQRNLESSGYFEMNRTNRQDGNWTG
ncbi:general substrate transporter [Aspergillus pseudoustus]|uniref:General substrate transporter n=1 Tax=Aspergillus pseudoustus TaxID=1810923 RepID=A0ABR4JU71_9EURO